MDNLNAAPTNKPIKDHHVINFPFVAKFYLIQWINGLLALAY
jgi:hypothetical protein